MENGSAVPAFWLRHHARGDQEGEEGKQGDEEQKQEGEQESEHMVVSDEHPVAEEEDEEQQQQEDDDDDDNAIDIDDTPQARGRKRRPGVHVRSRRKRSKTAEE